MNIYEIIPGTYITGRGTLSQRDQKVGSDKGMQSKVYLFILKPKYTACSLYERTSISFSVYTLLQRKYMLIKKSLSCFCVNISFVRFIESKGFWNNVCLSVQWLQSSNMESKYNKFCQESIFWPYFSLRKWSRKITLYMV